MFWDNVAGVYDVFVNVINRKTHQKLKEIVSDLIEPDDTVDGMKNHTLEEIEAALRAAGFSEVRSDHHPSKPWITVLARK